MTWQDGQAATARAALDALRSAALPSILSAHRQLFGIDLFLIQCDSCQHYYHGRCVSLPLCTAVTLTSYHCPSCSPSARYPIKPPTFPSSDLLFPPLLTGPAAAAASLSSSLPSDPFAVDSHGNTFLHTSVLLMDDPPTPSHPLYSSIPSLLTVANRDGYTPAHLASLLHLPAYLAFLLSFSPLLPTLSARTSPFRTTVHSSTYLYDLGGNTPLHLACQEGDEDTIELILTAIGLLPLSSSPLFCVPYAPSSADALPALVSLASSTNDAGLTPMDLLSLSSHLSAERRQELLDRYAGLLVGSGDEAEVKAKLVRQRKRVDVLDAWARAFGLQGRVKRPLALLLYAVEEEVRRDREETKDGEVVEVADVREEGDDDVHTCACGSSCRFRDVAFGIRRFANASRRTQDAPAG